MHLNPPIKKNPVLTGVVCSLALVITLFGCSQDSGYKPVDFSQTISIAQPEKKSSDTATVRVAVAAMISPKETIVYYQELLDYLGVRLGYRVQLIQKKTYGEINDLFPKGQIDLAFICTGPYAVGKEKYGFEALVTPVVRGKPFYQSYLIVHKDSPVLNLSGLRGRDFAFTDPESNTGALVPNFWLAKMGERPDSFFKNVTYTYSHDNSIMAVAKGLVDAAAVDGHKWEYYNRRRPSYTSKTRVIKKSEPFGSPPLVASTYLGEDLKMQIQKVLLGMHKDPQGERILKELMIDRFAVPQDKWYRPVRDMYYQVRESNKTHHVAEKS